MTVLSVMASRNPLVTTETVPTNTSINAKLATPVSSGIAAERGFQTQTNPSHVHLIFPSPAEQ
jgi:hypothetical protein